MLGLLGLLRLKLGGLGLQLCCCEVFRLVPSIVSPCRQRGSFSFGFKAFQNPSLRFSVLFFGENWCVLENFAIFLT